MRAIVAEDDPIAARLVVEHLKRRLERLSLLRNIRDLLGAALLPRVRPGHQLLGRRPAILNRGALL